MKGSVKKGTLFKVRIRVLLHGILLFILLFAGEMKVLALHNHDGAHDPSGIVKCDDTYWIFATGPGPYAMYSKDLVKWTAGKTPLIPGSFPSWVSNYVPEFEGHFWAPACFYMNGKYYLYYSCSSWGSTVSCIGLLTSKSLNPESPDYSWKDEGVVVYSTASSNYNCIDPAVLRDKDGKIWLTYGSHWDGIRMVELDSLSGKVSGSTTYSVAGKGDYKTEAAYVISRGGYYYLFFNRGQCCQGASSTYYIQVGRSSSPTGPFYDKSGMDCYQGGGTTIMSSSGSFIGPGCLGYFVENNTEWVTYHYYDGADGGEAKLGIGTFIWSEDGWPAFTRNWVENGHYSIINENSQLAWDYSGSGVEQDPVVQNAYTKAYSQKWTFEALGDGFYSIIPGGKNLVAGITPCTASVGTGIALGSPGSSSCQIWRVEQTNNLRYVFSSKYANRVLEVPGSSTGEGTQLTINYYTGSGSQHWRVQDTSVNVSANTIEEPSAQVNIYPNPVSGEYLHVEFGQDTPIGECEIDILTCDGRVVFTEIYQVEGIISIQNNLIPNTYFLRIRTNEHTYFKRLIIQR